MHWLKMQLSAKMNMDWSGILALGMVVNGKMVLGILVFGMMENGKMENFIHIVLICHNY